MKEHPDYKYRPRRKPKTLVKTSGGGNGSNSGGQGNHPSHNSGTSSHSPASSSSSSSISSLGSSKDSLHHHLHHPNRSQSPPGKSSPFNPATNPLTNPLGLPPGIFPPYHFAAYDLHQKAFWNLYGPHLLSSMVPAAAAAAYQMPSPHPLAFIKPPKSSPPSPIAPNSPPIPPSAGTNVI